MPREDVDQVATYEFSREENSVILSLAKRMRAVSMLLGLTGVLAISNAILGILAGNNPTALGGLIAGGFAILQAIVFFRPTDNLKNIVSTEGNDVGELMQGIKELAGGLKIVVILLACMTVIVVATVAMQS